MSFKRSLQSIYHVGSAFFQEGIILPRWATGIGVRLVLVLGLIGVSLGYVIQLSQTAVTGYEIHKLEKEVASLQRDNQDLSVDLAEYSSLNSIHERLASAHMEQASRISYLSLGNDAPAAVAQK